MSGAVHDVVVDERERVQQLERGADVDDDRVVGVPSGSDERAVAERRPQPLAAREHEIAQRGERGLETVVDRRPARHLGAEDRVDARLGPVGDLGEGGREDRADRARTHCERVRRGSERPSIAPVRRYIAPVLRFLSAEWVRAFDEALRADGGLGGRFAAHPIAIAQEVTVEPLVRYVIVLDGAGGRVESDARGVAADVTFVCDRETAAGLARGTMNAQRALTSGRLKIRGAVDRLAAASSGALSGLGDLLVDLRARTDY